MDSFTADIPAFTPLAKLSLFELYAIQLEITQYYLLRRPEVNNLSWHIQTLLTDRFQKTLTLNDVGELIDRIRLKEFN